MDKDITLQCEIGDNDGECLPLKKCACGQKFKYWSFYLGIYRDSSTRCDACGREMYFRNNITVYEKGGIMDLYIEPKETWECPECRKIHKEERNVYHCLYEHIKERCINLDFEGGFDLGYITYRYGLRWKLTDIQKTITKDSCFTISHLQCCDFPAYRISHISQYGSITVWGIGGWSGGYSTSINLDNLGNPRPKEELYIDKRANNGQ